MPSSLEESPVEDTDSYEGPDDPKKRETLKTLAKIPGVVAATIGATALGKFAYEAYQDNEITDGYVVNEVDSLEVRNVLKSALYYNSPILIVNKDVIGKKDDFIAATSEVATTKLTYSNAKYGIRYQIYMNSEFQIPPHEQLNDLLDFINERAGVRFSPVQEATMVVADFPEGFLSTTRVFPNGKNSMCLVDFKQEQSSSDNFIIEFAQAALGGKSSWEDLGMNAEVICNELGLAANSVLKDRSYEEYREFVPTKVHTPGKEWNLRPYFAFE